MKLTKTELTTILQCLENEKDNTFSDESDLETIGWQNVLDKLIEKIKGGLK